MSASGTGVTALALVQLSGSNMKPFHDQTREELLLTITILELRVVVAEYNAEQRKVQLENLGVSPFTSPLSLMPDALEQGRVYTDREWPKTGFGEIWS